MHLLDKIVNILVCCATTGSHGPVCVETSGDSTGACLVNFVDLPVAVRRQVPMVLCTETRGDSTVSAVACRKLLRFRSGRSMSHVVQVVQVPQVQLVERTIEIADRWKNR